MDNQTKLIEAFIEKPTTYEIEVLDNSMLPKGIKEKQSLKFTIKRPTMKVLAATAAPLAKVPKSLREKEELTLEEIVPYLNEIAEVIAILAHGASSRDIPEWYVGFFLANLTDNELFLIFKETSLKTENSFFLSYIQAASQTNPMMIEDSIPTS